MIASAPDAARTPRRDLLVALLLCLVTTGILLRSGRGEGYTRDEGYYFDAAELSWGWYGELAESTASGHPLQAFSRGSVERWFGFNHEHPVLMKTLYGWSWRLLHKCDCPRQGGRHPIGYPKKHRTLNLLGEAEAMRLPADLFAGILVAFVYLVGARAFSRRAGLIAAILTLAIPRYFFHAQLAAFDAPMATTWFVCVYCYWRSLDDRRWAWRSGLAFGIAFATKLNAFFLPFFFLAHYLWIHRASLRRFWSIPFPLTFVWMAVLGPIIEFVHWPWMWFDTVNRFGEYLSFHLHHVYYNMEYLGVNYNKPPFPKSYAFVMTLLTIPATTLALAAAGGVALYFLRRGDGKTVAPETGGLVPTWTAPALGLDKGTAALVWLNVLFPLCIIAFTGAPIFGGVKHWLAAFPFLALLAGLGADQIRRLVVNQFALDVRRARLAGALVVLGACLPAVLETARSHPYALTYYNLLAGGPAGGADLGLSRQYWGYSTRGVLPWIDQHAERNAPVYWHDTNQSILNMNVRGHLMRDDLGNTGLEEPGVHASTIAMVIHEKHFNKYEYWIWDFYHTARPSLVLTDEGVPIVTVYQRPEMRRP